MVGGMEMGKKKSPVPLTDSKERDTRKAYLQRNQGDYTCRVHVLVRRLLEL